MGSEQWTVQDAHEWRRLAPSVWATAVVAVIWLAAQAFLYLTSDLDWDELPWLLWHVVAIASIALIRHAPGLSFGFAVALAIYDVQFFELLGQPWPKAAVVLVYPSANALHAGYLRVAWDRQRRYASARAQTPVDLPPAPPAWPPLPMPVEAILWALMVWGGLILGVLLPALVGAEQGEVKDRGAVARAYGVVAVLLLFVVAPVAWRDRWRERKAVASLSSGSDRGLPVALFMSAQRKVTLYVRGEREPFAAFNARDAPNDEPPAVPLDSQIPGTLFGDLRSRGWAAVATGGVLILPETPLRISEDHLDDPHQPI